MSVFYWDTLGYMFLGSGWGLLSYFIPPQRVYIPILQVALWALPGWASSNLGPLTGNKNNETAQGYPAGLWWC